MVGGAPRIADSAAWIQLTPSRICDAGDHDLVLCDVTELTVPAELPDPLVFHAGAYRYLAPLNR